MRECLETQTQSQAFQHKLIQIGICPLLSIFGPSCNRCDIVKARQSSTSTLEDLAAGYGRDEQFAAMNRPMACLVSLPLPKYVELGEEGTKNQRQWQTCTMREA